MTLEVFTTCAHRVIANITECIISKPVVLSSNERTKRVRIYDNRLRVSCVEEYKIQHNKKSFAAQKRTTKLREYKI